VIPNVRNFSPTVTNVIFGVLIVLGSLGAAAAVLYATSPPAPAARVDMCPGADR
jgi:hypothetical protein